MDWGRLFNSIPSIVSSLMEQFVTHRIRLEECHGQMREAEIIWRHQVTCLPPDTPSPQHLMQTVIVALRTPSHGVFLDSATTERGCVFLPQLRAQELEREISELRRENSELRREVAHLKQRLDAICRRRQAEEYMRQEPTPGGPHRLHPPLRGKELTVKCGSSISAAGASQWATCPRG
ncbi:hypothetical protein Cadr_000022531 [Camelus dromedarius]|uniref:Uncharacterized protein n=1 Tax=Camelus dromedarius TaxID=9838 RepID=A0A5N4CG61_CAMDR|nr:hypothetical protein Cadr_000022531 [Camelus dromedarius]